MTKPSNKTIIGISLSGNTILSGKVKNGELIKSISKNVITGVVKKRS